MVYGVRYWVLLLSATILIAGGNIFYLTWIAHHTESPVGKAYPAVPSDNEIDFATLATNLVDHGTFSMSTSVPYELDSLRTPGYPLFIAPFYALFHSFYPVLIFQILTLFLTVILLFEMAKRVVGEKIALALCTLYLILPDTMISVSTLMVENVFTLVFMAALYLFFFSKIEDQYMRWGATGILFALATYIRPASLYVLVFFIPAYFLFYLPWKEFSRKYAVAALIMIAAFGGTLLPWYVRNEVQLGTASFSSVGPFVLFRQNASQFYEAFHNISYLDARYTLEDRAGIPHGPVPDDLAHAAILQKVALEVITEHPFRYAIFHVTGFIPFFTGSGAHDYGWLIRNMSEWPFNPAPEPSLMQALHPFNMSLLITDIENHGWFLLENAFWGLTMLLIVVGLWRSKNRRLAWMFFAIMLYFAAITGPIGHARYRIPVEPLMLVSAFSAGAYLFEHRKQKFLGLTST
jgi:4-amino-4-deoxy-L-arabinose transferase-like glycosyltransferase